MDKPRRPPAWGKILLIALRRRWPPPAPANLAYTAREWPPAEVFWAINWLRHPQANPRSAMPDLGVTERDAGDIAEYLSTLR